MSEGSSIEKLHERINIRGAAEKFLDIAVLRFKDKIKKAKIKGTDALLLSFKKALFYNGGNSLKAELTYYLYGRMTDMGVGKGVTWARQYYYRNRSARKADGIKRRPKRWYGKSCVCIPKVNRSIYWAVR